MRERRRRSPSAERATRRRAGRRREWRRERRRECGPESQRQSQLLVIEAGRAGITHGSQLLRTQAVACTSRETESRESRQEYERVLALTTLDGGESGRAPDERYVIGVTLCERVCKKRFFMDRRREREQATETMNQIPEEGTKGKASVSAKSSGVESARSYS